MAEAKAENLGTYHDKFFELRGTDKTADEYAALTDEKEITRIKEVYAAWAEKYMKSEKKEGQEEDGKEEPEVLNVSEDEKTDAGHENDGDEDWKDKKAKYWKQHCGKHEQDCERDAEDTEGLTLHISKEGQDIGTVHYADQKTASIAGAEGKTADYSVFLGLVQDAKNNNQAINFSGEMSPEFAAKLKLACEELGVAYQNAPEGKIDANGFEDQLSAETKQKLAEYNAGFDRQGENTQEDQNKSPYEKYLDKFQDSKEIDLSAITDEKEKVVAYAAAMVVATGNEDVTIKGAPEKTIGYKNEKVFEQDENGVIKRDEDGKPLMTENPLYAATKDLPEEARTALEGHNQGVRQQQLETARSRVAGTPERAKEAARRAEFRDNNHQYDENSNFNTRADREARVAAMKQYYGNSR